MWLTYLTMRSHLVIAAILVVGCHASEQADGVDAGSSGNAALDASRVDGPGIVPDDPCFPNPGAGHQVYTCNGLAFDVEVPAACANGGCGIILDVHGMTMSAAMEDANTELRARGGAAGFVVIQPSAKPAPPQAQWTTADEPIVYDFLTRAIAVYGIDPDRVHMTGFSQGGFMTWRFLCQHADLFASVAPAAAASSCPVVGNPSGPAACTFTGSELPSRKLPILYMHGRADQNYIPFSCAQPQVDAIVHAWNLTSEGVVASSPTYTRTRWSDGAGTVVELIAHDYFSNAQVPLVSATKLQGHCYPGSTDPGAQPGQLFSFRCEQPASFVWGDEVVEFFVAHPR
jgi:pimeloyl-ACP methyl ester carboxylesterase